MENNKKILLVDDDEFLLGIYAKNFRDEGFEVLIAHDGAEAWEIINEGNIPDIVFTGIIMPRMTGFELIAKMQADANLAKIPIAISSHRGRPEDKKTAEDMGVDEFIIQGMTTPLETIRRIKILLGIRSTYKVVIDTEKNDGKIFIDFLSKQQSVVCDTEKNKEIFLEIESKKEKGEFKINLKC
ncbi:MAG: response regulator [Candidatus Azambacteria bacterium]|nr:response regulator [Candidatus Azambacteria bacterium]